jgi:hypothetical protein
MGHLEACGIGPSPSSKPPVYEARDAHGRGVARRLGFLTGELD